MRERNKDKRKNRNEKVEERKEKNRKEKKRVTKREINLRKNDWSNKWKENQEWKKKKKDRKRMKKEKAERKKERKKERKRNQNWNKSSKVGDCSQGRPEGSLFNSYYTDVLGRALLLSLDCSTLPLIRTIYRWVLSKEVSSTIFKGVFGMKRPGIELRSLSPLANTLPTMAMNW